MTGISMCDFDKRLFTGAMSRLIGGALEFRRSEYKSDKKHMPGLAHGQHPDVLMIGCSDSRVDPALICNAPPGEIFTIRNVANLVPPFDFGDGRGHGVRAAIEYGVKARKVSNIVVFGHAHCGGIKAAIDTGFSIARLKEYPYLVEPFSLGLFSGRPSPSPWASYPSIRSMRCPAQQSLRCRPSASSDGR